MKFEFTSTWMEIFHLVWEILVMRESNRNRNSKVKRNNSFTSSKQEALVQNILTLAQLRILYTFFVEI